MPDASYDGFEGDGLDTNAPDLWGDYYNASYGNGGSTPGEGGSGGGGGGGGHYWGDDDDGGFQAERLPSGSGQTHFSNTSGEFTVYRHSDSDASNFHSVSMSPKSSDTGNVLGSYSEIGEPVIPETVFTYTPSLVGVHPADVTQSTTPG